MRAPTGFKVAFLSNNSRFIGKLAIVLLKNCFYHCREGYYPPVKNKGLIF